MSEDKHEDQAAASDAAGPEAGPGAGPERAGEANTPAEGEGTEAQGLRAQVERLAAELAAKHDAHLRALADHDNYRKRVIRDRAQQAEEAKRDFLAAVLPSIDALDLAIRHGADGPDAAALLEGLAAARQSLETAMRSQGVERIPVDRGFNPALHHAQAVVPSNDHEDGAIVEEIRSGYRIGNLVVRHASVVVAKRPERAAPGPEDAPPAG
jgi:molecular chaperone GrpE